MVDSFPAHALGYVVAVSGTPGSGNSTLTRKVVEHLGDAVGVHFDHYDREPSNSGPQDLRAWLAQGASPHAWQRPRLVTDLQTLRRGGAVTDARLGMPTGPAPHVVLDGPFGRSWAPVRDLLDFAVCIDVPMEIALARRVLRTAEHLTDSAAFHADVRQGMTQYLDGGQESYVRVLARVRAECDLLVDGTKDPDRVAEEVVHTVRAQRGLLTSRRP